MYSSLRNFLPAEEEYFSIDDILAANERVPCKFEVSVKKLGFLDPSSGETDLARGTKLQLPYWMAQALHNRRIISVEIPKGYREAYRDILDASANQVNLNKMGPYFYHFGLYLLRFSHPDSEDICRVLNQTFRNRFRMLMDKSQNAAVDDTIQLKATLDKTEVVLFNLGQKSHVDLTNWQYGKTHKITTAELIVNHKKRKRTNMEETA